MTSVGIAAARPVPRALLAAMRPAQWVKNVLVFAAPVAAGVAGRPEVAAESAVTFVAFVLSSSGCYLINDVYDVHRDRAHPAKRHRPVAAGELPVRAAAAAGVLLCLLGGAVALSTDHELLTVVVLTYIAATVGYGAGVKAVPGVELLVLTTGFVLRPLAGAAATGVRPSGWFLTVCCLAALTIVLGKRQVELTRLGVAATTHRPALARYTVAGLRRARHAAATGLVLGYIGWAMSREPGLARGFALLTLVPVTAGVVRLGQLNDARAGDAPEVLLLTDRWLQLAVAVWLLLFGLMLDHV